MNTSIKPRLEIYATNTNDEKDRILIGDFVDGSRGRKDAHRSLNDELKELEVRAVLYPQITLNDVAVERVFSDGYRQPLLRVPGSEADGYPTTGDEALAMECRRSRAFLDGKNAQVGSPPLTRLEERAYQTLGKQSHPDWLAVNELVETSTRRLEHHERMLLAQGNMEKLRAIHNQARPKEDDLASPEEVMAQRSRSIRM